MSDVEEFDALVGTEFVGIKKGPINPITVRVNGRCMTYDEYRARFSKSERAELQHNPIFIIKQEFV